MNAPSSERQLFQDRLDRLSVAGGMLHAAGGITTVVCAVLFATSVFRPLRCQCHVAGAAIAAAEDYLRQGADIEDRRRQAATALAERERRHQERMARVPANANESEFLSQLTELSASTGLSIQGYEWSEPVRFSNCESLPIHVQGHGEYDSLCRFLSGLDAMPRLCRVTKLRIAAPAGGGASLPIELTVQIFHTAGATNAGDGQLAQTDGPQRRP